MPEPHLRTRSRKRKQTRSPGGRSLVHYKSGVSAKSSCPLCGQPLAGASSRATSDRRGANRSKTRVWRPYGGRICHKCLKNSLKQSARSL